MIADWLQRWSEPALRLGLALFGGAIIGLNRDLHRKPIGVRTLGLVAFGSCLITLAIAREAAAQGVHSIDAASRVAQGIVSGIGFLGAGVILRTPDQQHVHGLTTAATIWVCAALGVACALAEGGLIVLGIAGTLLLLMLGGPLEKWLRRHLDAQRKPPNEGPLP